jgi:hypothetical protein
VDDSKSDKYEEVADFYIAWTLRCAEKKYETVDNAVHTYSKRLLSKLVKGGSDYLDHKDVLSVKTWKRRDAVDIWVEAKVQEECGDTAYTIIIEDKYCSKLTNAQLEKYKKNALATTLTLSILSLGWNRMINMTRAMEWFA